MELRSSSLFTCGSSSVRPLIPVSRLGTEKTRNPSISAKELSGQEVGKTVTFFQVRPKGARRTALATEHRKLIGFVPSCLVVGRFPSSKTVTLVELSVRSPNLCLCSSARKTSSIPLSWKFLDLESCSSSSNGFRRNNRSRSSTCASRLPPGARSRARTDTLEESSSNPTDRESRAESPSLPETLRSLQQAPGAPAVPRRKGKAKKPPSTRLSIVEERQPATSSPVTSGNSGRSKLLDELHHQLENEVSRSGGAVSEKPLDGEAARKMKERLLEQRRQGMQAISNTMKQRGQGVGGQGETFSYAVDPDTLSVGEFVVHKRVGVGCFIGIKYEIPPGKEKPVKYIYLKYADGVAKLRAKQANRLLYRYFSPGEVGRAPTLSKLNDTALWDKRMSKGKVAIQKLVVNMMELYIHRLKQTRPVYPKDKKLMASFAAKFPYTETVDQRQAIIDVERDLTERETPMDRLICGDVGFGKTEVALRALFLAAAAGRQAMVLAPTTVLAKQHYDVIRERFAGYDMKVALLSRFQKDNEKKEVITGISDGSLSIVVGTHALLGNQVRYHNLGLLVVDEEQRFGVRQKERITSMKTSVDVLTLSATPIPRTLYLALSGFRDASLITTPPAERRPIKTHLHEFNPEMVKKAIDFELKRDGQVFYVVPRVKGMEDTKAILESYFPDVGIGLAHGQQSAAALEDSMEQFSEGKCLILLCTSIVESGLDIRRVNTIIIEDVQLFGLAQLYQLRGRVGRADREAHAYMFHPSKEHLSDDALERLVALEDCCGLGQGFQLAERDMAIRGIGSVFGEKQSGDVAKIGVDLYLEMLFEGLSKVDHQKLPEVTFQEVQLDLVVSTHIPGDYVTSAALRDKVMQDAERAAHDSMNALMLFTNRLRNDYGPEPPTVEMLLKTLYVKRLAADLGIHRIRTRGKTVVMETNMEPEAFDMLSVAITSTSVQDSLSYAPGKIEMKGLIGLPVERQLERVFGCLAEMRNGLPSFVKYM
jgi:transcription-repair coupling factor